MRIKYLQAETNCNVIHFNQKNFKLPKIHKYSENISIFTTYGLILKKLMLKKKGFKRNYLFLKFIRVYIYKIFIFLGDLNYYNYHTLLFTPKSRYFLNFFLNSFKYYYFIYPYRMIFISNKNYQVKNKKKIKKKILKQLNKNYSFI